MEAPHILTVTVCNVVCGFLKPMDVTQSISSGLCSWPGLETWQVRLLYTYCFPFLTSFFNVLTFMKLVGQFQFPYWTLKTQLCDASDHMLQHSTFLQVENVWHCLREGCSELTCNTMQASCLFEFPASSHTLFCRCSIGLQWCSSVAAGHTVNAVLLSCNVSPVVKKLRSHLTEKKV